MKPDPAIAEYKDVIDKLKPIYGQPDFDQMMDTIAGNIPKPKKFLIKMELNRLAAPCSRRIDLRGHVDGNVRDFTHGGTTHYLDDVAIRIFNRGLKTYGSYAQGTYEDIMNADNNYRVMHHRQNKERLKSSAPESNIDSSELTKYQAKPVMFGERGFRLEERMIYAMPINVEIPLAGKIAASTTDLSVSGCKIKLPSSYKVMPGQTIGIEYKGLEEEYELGLKKPVEYEVVGLDNKGGNLYARCKRTNNIDTPTFDAFLNRFINGNKRRYKLNLDNTIEAVVTKGYEQFYLPRVTSLPVFLKPREDGALEPVATLTNDNNRGIIRQWIDENNKPRLGYLFGPKRMAALMRKPGRVKETIIYGFTHVAKGRVYFYSATDEELNLKPELRNVFLGFGSAKSVWFIYKIALIDCHKELANLPLTLPDSASREAQKLNKPPSARVMQYLEPIQHVAFITDISSEIARETYNKIEFDMAKVAQLKVFAHHKNSPPPHIEELMIKFVNLRSETRFIYRTTIEATGNQFSQAAVTRDFSTKGMQLEFENPIEVSKEEILELTMPDLQKITSRYKLKGLPYEVVSFNKEKTIVNLRVYEERGIVHQGKSFMNELIEKNRAKLKAAAQAGAGLPGLAEALRNIIAQRTLNTAIYIHKNGIKHTVDTLGFANVPNPLLDILNDEDSGDTYNLYPLLCNNYLNTLFVATLRKMQRHSRPIQQDVYIKYRKDAPSLSDKFEVQLVDDFRNEAAQKIFVQKSLQPNVLFFALRIYTSRTGRPDTDFIAKELAYVSQYAIHKAKVLEEELWSVAGVVDLIDISQEVMSRFGFPVKLINQQMQKRQTN
ncbi:PilZ domain-containing protein [Saccharobesus litoralis]|uniref:PilZ domain-containing protein n=1 Tax=Saccharobesus litoralis TaxID=2172099 RepID=A0A2S0VSR4_9ALTE|nr:PilZ domain-containing protein [Saccharobesus litoralis]AWB67254.1 PilZ domain-containing protein [Saccharobesus litoralis]